METEITKGTEITEILNHLDSGPDRLLVPPESIETVIPGCDDSPSRLKPWLIHEHFKCPVIGTCLSLDEQKKILKKAGYSIRNLSTYEIHGTLVNSLSSENRLSIRIDACLNRKFKNEISEFAFIDRPLFLDNWKKHFKEGEFAAILWVAATRCDLIEEDVCVIFGDVHMQMHLNAANNMKLKQQLSRQQEENEKILIRFNKSAELRRTLKKENEKFKRELSESNGRYKDIERKKLTLEDELSKIKEGAIVLNLEKENMELHAEIRKVKKEVSEQQQLQEQVNAFKNQNKQLCSELENQCKASEQLKNEFEKVLDQITSLTRCDETCPSFDLCKKRILIVGGVERMESAYRKLIEGNGGIFEYHDGHMKGGKKLLENQLKRADVVLCPININSHNACSAVKKYSKKHRKHVQMLASSGLNAISQALFEIERGGLALKPATHSLRGSAS